MCHYGKRAFRRSCLTFISDIACKPFSKLHSMEAQLRSAGQCCSTRQVLPGHTVHQYAFSRRAFGGRSRCCQRLSGHIEGKFRSPPCSASIEDGAGDLSTSTQPSTLPERCPLPGDGGQTAQYARAVGFAAVLCAALLALPDSASAAEALPLDFFAAFLVGVPSFHACII